MELIIFIVAIGYIISAIKKAAENEMRQNEANQAQRQEIYQAPKQATRVDSPRMQVQQQNNQWKKAAEENIAKARQRATQKLHEFEDGVIAELNGNAQPVKRTAMQQVHQGRVEANTTSIVERAKANTDAKKPDVTLETMEAEHNHSERVSAAVHYHPEDILPESMLGTVEDLMVKGFDGNLCFERDFVGEGLDMISRFSYQ